MKIVSRENFVNITFPFSRFCFALPNNFFFNVCHEDVGKRDCHFGTHSGAMGLEKIVSTELERIFLEYEQKGSIVNINNSPQCYAH